jgi:tetratricopeptide (TPR) repeat protein
MERLYVPTRRADGMVSRADGGTGELSTGSPEPLPGRRCDVPCSSKSIETNSHHPKGKAMSRAETSRSGMRTAAESMTKEQRAGLAAALRAADRGDLRRAVDGVAEMLGGESLGPAASLHARKLLIEWLEALGRFDECRQAATEGVADLRARLGAAHELTLVMRHSELYWMCVTGYDEVARGRFPVLIRDIERALGRTSQLAWAARTNSAMPLKRGGDFAGAARVYRRLLHDMGEVLEDTDAIVLTTRDNLAEALACDGRYEESTTLYEALLADLVASCPSGDRRVLRLRDEIASNAFCMGDHARARELWSVLAEDCRRHLGECAPETARQRTLQIALSIQDGDDAAVARWCRVLLDNLPGDFTDEDAEGFRILLRESRERLDRSGDTA